MKQEWLLFLKYPYSTGVLLCIWLGSAAMVFINRSLPIVLIIAINILASWLITWFGFRPTTLK